MAAKELKALVDFGTSLGYTGEDLKQWLNEERMRIEREKEEEKKRQEEEKKRAFKLEKVKIETEKKAERMKLVAEAEKAKIEAERRRQEFELRKIEMEHDLRLREAQINVEQDGGGAGKVPSSNRGHSIAMKALKIPLFNDEKDDLDAYLIRFEKACAAFEIRQAFWSTQLARLLQGRSLDVYQRLPAEEVDNYESLKTQLLKRFRLVGVSCVVSCDTSRTKRTSIITVLPGMRVHI